MKFCDAQSQQLAHFPQFSPGFASIFCYSLQTYIPSQTSLTKKKKKKKRKEMLTSNSKTLLV
jgi:hypothetical protein